MSDPRITGLILRGAPRSGTTLTQTWLVPEHFRGVQLDETGGRHGMLDFARVSSRTKALVCIKHPMSWLYSMYKYCSMQKVGPMTIVGIKAVSVRGFEAFVKSNPWLFKYWIASNTNWLSLDPIVVDYGQLISDPENVIRSIGDSFNIKVTKDIKPLPEMHIHRGIKFDRDYYVEEKWRAHYRSGLWKYCRKMFYEADIGPMSCFNTEWEER